MRKQIQWKTEKQTQDKNGESTNKILWHYFIYELYGSIIYSEVKKKKKKGEPFDQKATCTTKQEPLANS